MNDNSPAKQAIEDAWIAFIESDSWRTALHLTQLGRQEAGESWRDMQDFWADEHPEDMDAFHGLLIKWSPP